MRLMLGQQGIQTNKDSHQGLYANLFIRSPLILSVLRNWSL